MYSELKEAARLAGHAISEGKHVQPSDIQPLRDFFFFQGKNPDTMFAAFAHQAFLAVGVPPLLAAVIEAPVAAFIEEEVTKLFSNDEPKEEVVEKAPEPTVVASPKNTSVKTYKGTV